ncbi:hypothetical protein [Pontibacter arcticus]|uniref:LTXXQ motif family protein n=1 Tax=Pontibacter arcticus TaxID=2080288 RepID=A0A364RBU4_9BACT|nr:hypothetical protein [Pontibacter arcticus]RAU81762.1 hypothetical protein DP923_13760 [Pontibacter arcticus]
MKKTAFVLLLTIFASSAYAQSIAAQQSTTTTPTKAAPAAKTVEQRAEEITNGMSRNLRLNAEQTKKLYVINLESMKQAEKAKVKHKNDPRKTVQQMDIISQTRLSQVKDILSPAQFQQYQERREEKMGVPREVRSNPAARQQSPMNEENN